MALAADSASACSWRRNDAPLAVSDWRILAPSVPASCTVVDSSTSSGTSSSTPTAASAVQGATPPSRACSKACAIRRAAQSGVTWEAAKSAPSIPTPPARLSTTRSTKDPITTRKCRRRCEAC